MNKQVDPTKIQWMTQDQTKMKIDLGFEGLPIELYDSRRFPLTGQPTLPGYGTTTTTQFQQYQQVLPEYVPKNRQCGFTFPEVYKVYQYVLKAALGKAASKLNVNSQTSPNRSDVYLWIFRYEESLHSLRFVFTNNTLMQSWYVQEQDGVGWSVGASDIKTLPMVQFLMSLAVA